MSEPVEGLQDEESNGLAIRSLEEQLTQKIAMEIRRDDRINAVRPHHHARRHGVDQHFLPADPRVLPRHLARDSIPQHQPMAHAIALRHDGEMFFRSLTSRLKRKAHDPFDADAREDADFRALRWGLVRDRYISGIERSEAEKRDTRHLECNQRFTSTGNIA